MAGVKGKSGRRTKKEELNYNTLQRYSLVYLLRLMRAKEGSPIYDKEKQFKIALDVTGKTLNKPVIDNSTHKHFTYVWNEEDKNQLQAAALSRGNTEVSSEI